MNSSSSDENEVDDGGGKECSFERGGVPCKGVDVSRGEKNLSHWKRFGAMVCLFEERERGGVGYGKSNHFQPSFNRPRPGVNGAAWGCMLPTRNCMCQHQFRLDKACLRKAHEDVARQAPAVASENHQIELGGSFDIQKRLQTIKRYRDLHKFYEFGAGKNIG